MKNEHIVYAFAPLLEGGNLLLIGITDVGWEFLKKEYGNFLHVKSSSGEFRDVKETWVVRGKDKQDIHSMIETIARQMGVTLTIAHREDQ